MTGELRQRDAPEGEFDAEKEREKDPHRLATEERIAERQRNVAIVLNRGRENKRPPPLVGRNPKTSGTQARHGDSEGNRGKAKDGRKDPVFRIRESFVADDGVKRQGRREQSHDETRE